MLNRKIYQTLLDWKRSRAPQSRVPQSGAPQSRAHQTETHRSDTRKCLVLKGARQVGKTYIARAFGNTEYESFLEIDFLRQPEMKEIFTGELTSNEILKRMSAYMPNYQLIPGSTLILLDEIQCCANARTALKFLAQDNRIDVIATGSLLGLKLGQDADEAVEPVPSIPVGYELPVMMYSLDFEEFLWSQGYGPDAVAYLRGLFEAEQRVPDAINAKYHQLVREFMVVGGMPDAVSAFATNHDFAEVQRIQEALVSDYGEDIAHHAKGAEKTKALQCFNSIPRQLARENKKFKYSEMEKKATARKFGGSVQWLVDANMALRCPNTETPALPLKYNHKENEFKLYVHDTGLLMAMYGAETKRALLNGSLKGNGKGGIYENFVAETLVKSGYELSYYKPNEGSELEFLIEKDGEVAPVEVKAGNSATKSLNRFIERQKPRVAYKVMGGNLGRDGVKLSLPHYMAMFI